MIEKVILDYLSTTLNLPCYMEVPQNPPKELAGSKVITIKDFLTLEESTKDGKKKLIMPDKSNVLQWFCENGNKVSVRPSGTEPKIKFYLEIKDNSMKTAVDYRKCVENAKLKVEQIKQSLNI